MEKEPEPPTITRESKQCPEPCGKTFYRDPDQKDVTWARVKYCPEHAAINSTQRAKLGFVAKPRGKNRQQGKKSAVDKVSKPKPVQRPAVTPEPAANEVKTITTTEQFDTILQARINNIQSVLGSKAREYSQNGDRLFNFRKAAQINNCTMPEALWGMATKHLVSVQDLVEGRLEATPEMVNEKITDMINYLILLEAIFLEGYTDAAK